MINLSLCTISFRHQLISIEQLAKWARAQQFHGLEIWGIHAHNLAHQSEYDEQWLASLGLHATMISDYLPLDGDPYATQQKAALLCERASHWGTRKIRSFAGQQASHSVTQEQRCLMVRRLQRLCDQLADYGCELLIETHPHTLADTAASTRQLLEEVDHPSLKLNFDVLHLWEAGDDPWVVYRELKPFIKHFHLKNISERRLLPIFAPANVYSPAGSRDGMVSLFEGEFDYSRFLLQVAGETSIEASLEWFGSPVKEVLQRDREQIAHIMQAANAKTFLQAHALTV